MGAQVLLSQEAWERLCLTMPAAGFPTVEQLGLFRLAAWPAPMWLYQARCPLACPYVECLLCYAMERMSTPALLSAFG